MENDREFKSFVKRFGTNWFAARLTNRGDEQNPQWEMLVYIEETQPDIVGTWFSNMYFEGEEVEPEQGYLDQGFLTMVKEYGDPFAHAQNRIELHFREEPTSTVKWVRMDPSHEPGDSYKKGMVEEIDVSDTFSNHMKEHYGL